MESSLKNNKFHVGDLIEYNLSAFKIIGTNFEKGLIVKVEVLSKNERMYHVLNSKKVCIINDKIYLIRPFSTGELNRQKDQKLNYLLVT